MGKLKAKLKATVGGLTSTQQAILVFVSSILPPVILWLQQVGSGTEITTQSLALLGSAILGGVLAAIVKMLSPTPVVVPVTDELEDLDKPETVVEALERVKSEESKTDMV